MNMGIIGYNSTTTGFLNCRNNRSTQKLQRPNCGGCIFLHICSLIMFYNLSSRMKKRLFTCTLITSNFMKQVTNNRMSESKMTIKYYVLHPILHAWKREIGYSLLKNLNKEPCGKPNILRKQFSADVIFIEMHNIFIYQKLCRKQKSNPF